jgi:hypothetical protein
MAYALHSDVVGSPEQDPLRPGGHYVRNSRLRGGAALIVATLALTALGACGDDKKGSGGGDKPKAFENSVSISGVDYGFIVGKPSVKAGRTRIEFKNDGKDIHMLAMQQIKPGKTFEDAKKALESEDEKDDAAYFDPDDSGPVGAPQILTSGSKTAAYPDLKAGTYALVCYFSTAEGKPHFLAGMLNKLTVTDDAAEAVEPETDDEVTLAEGKLTIPDLSSGKATLKVRNTGTQDHDFTIARVAEGKTFDDMVAFLDKFFGQEGGKIADMPGGIAGGIGSIPAGSTYFVELDLSPGKYVAICTESTDDEKEQTEHFRTAGEKVEFTVT